MKWLRIMRRGVLGNIDTSYNFVNGNRRGNRRDTFGLPLDSKSQYVNPFRCEIRKTALEAPQAPKILKLAVTNTVSMQNVKQNVTRCVPRSARASGHLSTRNSATRKPATLHTCAYVFFAWVCKLPSPQACEREISATGHIAFYGFANAAAPPFVHERAARKRWCTHPTPAKNPLLHAKSKCAEPMCTSPPPVHHSAPCATDWTGSGLSH